MKKNFMFVMLALFCLLIPTEAMSSEGDISYKETFKNSDYVAAGTGLRFESSGAISIKGIPSNVIISKAYLYWAYSTRYDEHDNGSLYLIDFDYKQYQGEMIGEADGICWSNIMGAHTKTYAFRADVTDQVEDRGNATYYIECAPLTLTEIPQGASLVIVYQFTDKYKGRNVIIWDGNSVLNTPTIKQYEITDFTAGYEPEAKTTFIVGGGTPEGVLLWNNQPIPSYLDWLAITTDLQILPPTPDNRDRFRAEDGSYWDTVTEDNILLSEGETSIDVEISTNVAPPDGYPDCLAWVAQVTSVDCSCSEVLEVGSVYTIGKGQSPTNNEKVKHLITGKVVESDNPKDTVIEACEGTKVTIEVTDYSGHGLTIYTTVGDNTDPPGNVTYQYTSGPDWESCEITINDFKGDFKYKAVSSDGKDTDRIKVWPLFN